MVERLIRVGSRQLQNHQHGEPMKRFLVRFHFTACHPEAALNAESPCASLAVLGPRSFSYTRLFRVRTNVITPDARYATGYATTATLVCFAPGTAPDVPTAVLSGRPATIRK